MPTATAADHRSAVADRLLACPPAPRRYVEGEYKHGTCGGQLDSGPPGAEAAASARDAAVERTDEPSSMATADADARTRPHLARSSGVRSGRPRPGEVRTGRAHPARRAAPRHCVCWVRTRGFRFRRGPWIEWCRATPRVSSCGVRL